MLESKFFQGDLLKDGSVNSVSHPTVEDDSLYTLESGRKDLDLTNEIEGEEETTDAAAAPETAEIATSTEEAGHAVEATEGAKVESAKSIEIAEPEAEPAAFVAPEGTTGVEATQPIPTPEPTPTEPVTVETQGGFLTGGESTA